MLDTKINDLKGMLVWSATFVERMIEKSISGLINKDKKLLTEVIQKDEPIINQKEIDIEKQCINLIALYQPEAKDLRIILMVMKMNNDIERIGDLAVNISESALYLINKPDIKPLIDIPRMAEESKKMLKDSVWAFVNENENVSYKVIKNDNIVDNLQEQIFRELITFMAEDPSVIKRALHLIRISHNLERVADLATNFCEDTIYIIKGEIIKHSQK